VLLLVGLYWMLQDGWEALTSATAAAAAAAAAAAVVTEMGVPAAATPPAAAVMLVQMVMSLSRCLPMRAVGSA
jgi:hypothetical protein